MQRCTYRVFEFAKSEREVRGLTFAILLRFEDLREHFLKSFYLSGWEEAIGNPYEAQIAYVRDVLYSFRKYAHKRFEDSEEVLIISENLSVGPLRTGLAGMAVLPSLEKIDRELREDQDDQECSPEAFAALLKALCANPLYRLDEGLSAWPQSKPA